MSLSRSQLIVALQKVPDDVSLVKNQVGNLAMVRNGEYIGYVDLVFGRVVEFDEGDEE